MPATIDYYFVPQSPWAYLGHTRFTAIAREAGARINVMPMDLAQVFPASGGLPLAQRAPQRQAYRLTELKRYSDHLGLPMNMQPAFFPVAGDAAARLIVAVAMHDGSEAAMALAGALLSAVWAGQRDIADAAELAGALTTLGLPAQRLSESAASEVQTRYVHNTSSAIAAGVFGAPSYVIDGEIFWGQDRLDFVQRALVHR